MYAPILLCGRDATLLKIRTEILRSSGFEVLKTYRPEELDDLAEKYPVSMLILCHTLSAEDQERAIVRVREFRPHARSVILTASHTTKISKTPDAVVYVTDGPRTLLKMVRSLLMRD